ncbi:uncharacterized protein LOC110717260 isoform X1 [Chenopodium quinoa]|uniref:uncharacterized protein LOC110717260 isoform X1 n=1 Tax=Chenopodium quinoa TaxID=63459 RepID=UPI000B7972AD|nr:uncharacterized protein LOC110717260 isoform X1 [Chenopodium quinoa]
MLGKAIQSGTKIPVEWHPTYGVPFGDKKNRTTLSSYIGVVAREPVNINYKNWGDVPKEIVDEEYEIIAKGFDVLEKRKKYILGRASIRWRAFKTRLRKYWLYKVHGNKKVVRKTSPWKYPMILQTNWNKFIKTYIEDDAFQSTLDAQAQRGEITAKGRDDVLAKAINKSDHGGRVRAVGSGVSNKAYFGYNQPTPPNRMQAQVNYLMKRWVL